MGAEVKDAHRQSYGKIGSVAVSDQFLSRLSEALMAAGRYPKQISKHLMSSPSFTLFDIAAAEALPLYYFAQGRRSGDLRDGSYETNQILDTNYLAYALACRGLMSAEKILRRLDAGLREALSARWP